MITDGSPTYFFQHTVGQSVVFQNDGLPTPVGSGVEWQPTCNKKPWRSGIPKPADGDAIGESKWISMFMSKNLITQLLHQITGDFLMNNQPILGRGPKRTQNEPADPSCLTPQHHVSKSQEVRRPLHQTPWKGGTSGKYDGDFIRFVRPNHFFVGSYRTYVPCISQVPKNDDKYIYIYKYTSISTWCGNSFEFFCFKLHVARLPKLTLIDPSCQWVDPSSYVSLIPEYGLVGIHDPWYLYNLTILSVDVRLVWSFKFVNIRSWWWLVRTRWISPIYTKRCLFGFIPSTFISSI